MLPDLPEPCSAGGPTGSPTVGAIGGASGGAIGGAIGGATVYQGNNEHNKKRGSLCILFQK